MRAPRQSVWPVPERMLLEETVIPSPNRTELERTARGDFLHRFGGPAANVAELFQVNSRLSPSSTLTIPADPRRLEELREWYFSTAYAMREEDVNAERAGEFRLSLEALPAGVRSLLEPFARPGAAANLLFSLDIFVLHQQHLLRFVPQAPVLWLDRTKDAAAIGELREAVLEIPAEVLQTAASFLFVVACPWRYMLLYGPRGYRHTLLDAGRLLAELERLAREKGIPIAVTQNFYDGPVDRFLALDGVERSTLVVLAFPESGSQMGTP